MRLLEVNNNIMNVGQFEYLGSDFVNTLHSFFIIHSGCL